MSKWEVWKEIIEILEKLDNYISSEQEGWRWSDVEKECLANAQHHISTALRYAFLGLQDRAKKEAENVIMKIDTEK